MKNHTKFITTKRKLREIFPQTQQTIDDTPSPDKGPSKFELEMQEFNEWLENAGKREDSISA